LDQKNEVNNVAVTRYEPIRTISYALIIDNGIIVPKICDCLLLSQISWSQQNIAASIASL
jgi:hypothetical protein